MKSSEIFKYVLIAGGVYALYWYVTNYGPAGGVFNSSGQQTGGATWWQTWFGGAPATGTTTQTNVTTNTTNTTNNTATNNPPPPPPANSTPPANVFGGVLNLNGNMNPIIVATTILATNSSTFKNQNGTLNGSQWNYFVDRVAGGQLTMPAIPGDTGANMTLAQYTALLVAANLVPANNIQPVANWQTLSGLGGLNGVGVSGDYPATNDQISQIISYLSAKDIPIFADMVRNRLTSSQASIMLMNARKMNGFSGGATGMGMAGMGAITPTPTVQASTHSPAPSGMSGLATGPRNVTPPQRTRSPWGRLAAVDNGMNWKN